jgi:tetratricopeptide (TPR) repeat protein
MGAAYKAGAVLPSWAQTVVGGSPVEAALFRMMQVPGLSVLYPRPPAEAVPALSALVAKNPADAQLYALRAHSEEEALDFTAAERDWKAVVTHAQDVAAAETQLADFYHRRLQPADEVAALLRAAAVPSRASERFESAEKQRAWRSFERVMAVVQDQALPPDASVAAYKAWIARYPAEASVRSAYVNFLIERKRYDDARAAIAAYQAAFPKDEVFPIQATAALAYEQGSAAEALAIYEKAYQPLWPQALAESYYGLLAETHSLRHVLAAEQARFASDPNDYAAAAKVFELARLAGRNDAATRELAEYRLAKESRRLPWGGDELYTFAAMLDRAGMSSDAAKYYFALADSPGKLTLSTEAPQQVALAALARILLTQPGQPLALGAGNLAIYQDIATTDHGPGYWNGILSLWMNSEDPAAEFHDEEQKATPYFHRAKAAELLAMLDQRFPYAAEAASLHAELLDSYVVYGEDDAVLKEGASFLARFPHASERVPVAMHMADVYSRRNDTAAEFALYEALLSELAARSGSMPLTAAGAAQPAVQPLGAAPDTPDRSDEEYANAVVEPVKRATPVAAAVPALAVNAVDNSAAVEYSQLLERYLGRLTMTKRLPEALALLRRQLDRSPDDPAFYSRLAEFLAQNDLSAQEEEVYTKAIAKFNQPGWYDKLARFYLRQRRRQEFGTLTRKVVETFSGTELESYFGNVTRNDGWGQMYVQLNLYAHQRFPHDLTFTNNLLNAYRQKGTRDDAAWETLIRQHWTESRMLRNEFFDYLASNLASDLASNDRLDGELAALEKLVPDASAVQKDPAATRELAEIDLWNSHFEAGAPLLAAVARQYPADAETGEQASSVFRSLAYYDPAQVAESVAIEKNLLAADPANTDRMTRVGDIYADSTSSALNLDPLEQLARAAPYWRRIPTVHPGSSEGYLQAATVFWDYFQFDDALKEIEAARQRFHQPTMYGYEAGAIFENKRDAAHAVAEYVMAATTGDAAAAASGEAGQRLLILSGKKEYAAMVDAATAKAAANHANVAALNLRVAVLKARKEAAGVGPLADAAIAGAATPQAAAELAGFAQQHDLPVAYRHALEREIALSAGADPADRIPLQYELVASLEQSGRPGDIGQAQSIMDGVYKDNPKLLGVVRRTVDFDWQHHEAKAAIAVLTRAAHDANAELAANFTIEAATKSNASGEFAQARTLLAPLLEHDPYDAKLISIAADSYALAHDQAGLRDFYLAKLAALKTANLPKEVRRDDTALMRQGLILALTELKDYAGAVDQHIALISAFPEDENIQQTAALYALRYGRQAQLVGFLNKTVAESPRDSRFAILLARTATLFEDYEGALAAYSKAIAIRKDRADLYIARADLEERMQRFDAVCADYDRLYVLSYKDPRWMERAALAWARQGKNELAVEALQTAWIEGRSPAPENFFRVASQLEQWRIIEPARLFAEQGIKLAGGDLLPKYAGDGAALYARIMIRERHWGETLAFLDKALADANVSASSPSVVMQQVERNGIASVTDAEWRRRFATLRQQQASDGYQLAVEAASHTVAELYTPEEKEGFAELLDAHRANRPADEVASRWIPAAQAAGLRDREAAWRRDVLLFGPWYLAQQQLVPYNSLEDSRLDNANHARTLEQYAIEVKPAERAEVLFAAEAAWRAEGDHASELRVLKQLRALVEAPQTDDRYFWLLLHSNPGALIAENTDAAANYVLANTNASSAAEQLAYRAIDTRAKTRKPVWGSATTALTGLFFADTSPRIDAAFQSTLGDMTISQRIKRPDSDREIVGASWFAYGMRYGVFRTLSPAADPEDYLAAELEAHPSVTASYLELASAYADAKKVDAALAEYDHALEITDDRASIHIAKAEQLWSANRHPEALAEWKTALTGLRRLVDTRAVPESFWIDFASIAADLRERGLGARFKPELEGVLKPYIVKNGEYRSGELLHSALIALSKPETPDAPADAGLAADEASTTWIVTLAEASADPASLLAELSNETWFPRGRLGPVYARRLQLAEAEEVAAAAAKQAGTNGGGEYGGVDHRADSLRSTYIRFLMDHGEFAEAEAVYDRTPRDARGYGNLPKLLILLRAREGRTAELVASFSSDPADAPSLDVIAAAANELRAKSGSADDFARNKAAARSLLEYVFAQKLSLNQLAAPDYLALAQSRLETPGLGTNGAPDVAGALELLRRMTLLPGDLYANIDSAADLLVRSGHTAEALPLLKTLATANPWMPEYRLRLAKAEAATGNGTDAGAALVELAASGDASYSLRARAAEAKHGLPGQATFASAELTLLAANSATPAQASHAYYVRARELAAATAPVAARPALLRAALAFVPGDALRLELFHAEAAAGQTERALATVQPLLGPYSPGYLNGRYGRYAYYPHASAAQNAGNSLAADLSVTDLSQHGPDEAETDSESDDTTTNDLSPAEVAFPSLIVSPAKKLAFSADLATVYERLGEDDQAVPWLQAARVWSKTPAQQAVVVKRIAAARARIATKQANAARRPVVQVSLDQAVLARPRVDAPPGGRP